MRLDTHTLLLFFTGAFFSILFIQSSLDKLFNWKGELAFNEEHFSKTFLGPFTLLIFAALTFMEFLSGVLSLIGVIMLYNTGFTVYPFLAGCLCASTLLCLFLGQRIAKDYAGAQSLVSYFIVSLIAIYLTLP